MTDKELETHNCPLRAQRELDAQGMDGPRGWSGNPQRLSVRGRGGGSFAGQPAILARNQEAITSRFTQLPVNTLDMVQVDHYFWDEKRARMAKVFPSMCKPDAETPPRKSRCLPLARQRKHRRATRIAERRYLAGGSGTALCSAANSHLPLRLI